MAIITTEITSILEDSRGEDVRDSIVSALEKIFTQSIPIVTVANSGKALVVNSQGEWSSQFLYVPASITITSQPDKTEYEQNEEFDLTGVVVTGTFNTTTGSAFTKDVTDSCIFSPADGDVLLEAGTQIVTVSYTENGATVTNSFDVIVNAQEVNE